MLGSEAPVIDEARSLRLEESRYRHGGGNRFVTAAAVRGYL